MRSPVFALAQGLLLGQQGASGRELSNGMIAVVGGKDSPIGGDVDARRAHGEITLAPGAQEVALAVVDDYEVLATADQKYAVLLIDGHTRHIPMCKALGQLLPALGQLLPALDHLVLHLIGHAGLPFTLEPAITTFARAPLLQTLLHPSSPAITSASAAVLACCSGLIDPVPRNSIRATFSPRASMGAIGQPLRRKEDERLLTGKGRFS